MGVNEYSVRVASQRRILVVSARAARSLGVADLIRELGEISVQEIEECAELAEYHLPEGPWDLVVLSMHLPCDGALTWIRQMRSLAGRSPIAVVANNAGSEQVVSMLDSGADDVVPMPAPDALVRARTQALLRATSGMYPATAAAAQLPQASPDISLKGAELRVQGVPIQLTATESALVATLLERRRQWRTASELLQHTFDVPGNGDTSLVRVHVFNIRRKLGGLAYCLQGRRRFGYRIL